MPTRLRITALILVFCGAALLLPAGADGKDPGPTQATLVKNLGSVQGELQAVSVSSSGGSVTLRVLEATLASARTSHGSHLGLYLKPKRTTNPRMPAKMRGNQVELDPHAVLRQQGVLPKIRMTHHDYELPLTPNSQVRWQRATKTTNGKIEAKASDLSAGQTVVVHLVMPADALNKKPDPGNMPQPQADKIVIVNPPDAPPAKKQ